jgi:hypothetical protein
VKQPFRYFRGEFNGKYLYELVRCPNFHVQDILDELVYQILFQWKLEEELAAGEMAIREEDIFNIGKIAGLFQPRTFGRVSLGSVYFTQSHIVNGKQRSERGLVDMLFESFRFVRTERDEYPDDIVNEASVDKRIGMLPSGSIPEGYVRFDTPLYTIEGDIIWENVLPEPPTDVPYIEFFGEKYLVHEEFFDRETPLPLQVYKLLLECVMRLRRNGPTITELLEITRILGEGFICDLEVVQSGRYYTLYYRLNEDAVTLYRERRFSAWQMVCKQKFKLFVLEPHPL